MDTSVKRTKKLTANNQIDLCADVTSDIGVCKERMGVYITAYYDHKDDKLALTAAGNQAESVEALTDLKLNSVTVEDFQSNENQSGKVTLTAVDDEEITQTFEQAESAVLRIEHLNDDQHPVWVSVYPAEEYREENVDVETVETTHEGNVEERKVTTDNFANLGAPK